MSDIPLRRLCDLAHITMGQSPDADRILADAAGLPFLQGCAEFGAMHPTAVATCSPPLRVAPEGSVLISVRAPVGTMNVADRAYCIGRGLGAFKAKDELADTIFLKHAAEQGAPWLHRRSQGSTFAAISADDLRSLPVPDFSPSVQRRIAAILTSLDTAIEATEALIEKHQQIKVGLMHDLLSFGVLSVRQFGPAHQFVPRAVSVGLLEPLGQCWDLVPASSVCSLITKGTTPAAEDMWQGGSGVRFLRVENLTFNGDLTFDCSDVRVSPKTHATTLARSRCQRDDVLMNIVGPPLGKVGLVDDEEVNINQAIAVFRPTQEINARYLLLWLTSEFAKRWILQRAKQTSGQVNVTLAMCQALPVPLAPIDEQLRIVECVDAARAVLKALTIQAEKLRMQKQGLMQDLLTGKVPIRAD